jgi:hypothetical protein
MAMLGPSADGLSQCRAWSHDASGQISAKLAYVYFEDEPGRWSRAGDDVRAFNPRMPGQQIEHVVKKADPSFDRRRAGPVEIDGDLDVGFLGLARHRAFAHFTLPIAVSGSILPLRGPFIRADPNSPLAPSRICIAGSQLLNHALSKRFPA